MSADLHCHWPGSCTKGIVHQGPCEPEDLALSPSDLWREHIGIGYEDTYRDWSGNVLKIPADPADR